MLRKNTLPSAITIKLSLLKSIFFPIILISATAVGQINQGDPIGPKIEKAARSSLKPNKLFYVTAGVGDSWESTVTNNRRDETESPTLGPITYERQSDKKVRGASSIEAGLGYHIGNNLRAELTYLYKAKSAVSETTTGTVFYSGGSMTFKGETKVSGKINKHCVIANLYYDLPIKTRLVPFVGGGLGFANVSTTEMIYNYDIVYSNGNRVIGSRTEPEASGNALVYQAKLGINYLLSKKTAVFFTGNYCHINKVDIGGGTIYEDFNIFGIKVGVVYRFAKNAH